MGEIVKDKFNLYVCTGMWDTYMIKNPSFHQSPLAAIAGGKLYHSKSKKRSDSLPHIGSFCIIGELRCGDDVNFENSLGCTKP
jgi:hypothetical protein